jgi:sugar phosphate isomerase/epimerase
MTWELALSSSVFTGRPLVQMLPTIKQAGFELLEATLSPGHLDLRDPDQVNEIRTSLNQLGLKVISLHAPFGGIADITLPDDAARLNAVNQVKASIDSLLALGGQTLVIHGGSDNEESSREVPTRLARAVQSLTEIQGYCRPRGISIAVETMLGHLVGGRKGQLDWVLSKIPEQDTGVCLDTGHCFLAGDLLEKTRRFGNRLKVIHAHDNLGVHDDHLPPGEGKINWPEFLNTLASTGFHGEFVIEVGSSSADQSLKRVTRSVDFLKKLSAGRPYHFSGGG